MKDLKIDDLDRAIVGLCARINAATYELLVLIRRFDERGGWLAWGFECCADWLHWRCDIGLSAAREKVRVAHALKTLPATSMAFAEGTLSYSKVRALTRVANANNEHDLLAFALKTTAEQVAERCRELRCGTELSREEARRSFARRALTMHRNPERGTLTITVDLPIEAGELIDKALDRARDDRSASMPEFADESWSAQRADALIAMARAYLAEDRESPVGASDNYRVTVHVDSTALAGGQGRSGLPIESVKRLCCDGETVTIVEDADGEPLNVGRKTRVVPTAIRRALWARDRGCTFPACHRKRFVDAHHVQHWAAGGETSLANMLLLCDRHHRMVHEEGYRIVKDYGDRWCFLRPDGVAVPSCGYRPEDVTDAPLANDSHSENPSAEGFADGSDQCAGSVLFSTVRTSE
ncbi:MAG: DUF222 domain-containing protein [Woeseiaceae bacterium]